ncbi:InlB B-repeat-containing protein [Bifidobacterium vespertilionis]|uniref:InlB B-repeat-containing protein n=1 Tax=Bifidobacterium vespertilionis TaxID=2562524 RepID=UPI001BDD6CC4|nr:InlB B-repeat-containing protein [Bifidobacterium vespertilionis]MBT1180218.1 InlB B-repeat-containing protein [Bifidobacterium vespertilionis]
MTGNNKFWRASLAGLASVAMLATMGVTAANAADASAPTASTTFGVKVFAATDPAADLPLYAGSGKYGDVLDLGSLPLTANPYYGTADHKLLTGYSYDLAGKNLVAADGLIAIKGDVKLYAQYATASNVTFDVDPDTTGDEKTIEVKTGTAVDAEAYAASGAESAAKAEADSKGLVFAGWKYTKASDAQDLYTNQSIEKDVTLYPVYEKYGDAWGISYQQNLSEVNFHVSDSTTTETLYTLANRPFPAFRAPSFSGVSQWSASADNKAAYDFTANVANSKANYGEADLTLYGFGNFGDSNWTINYEFNGANATASTTNVAAGSTAAKPNEPALWGSQFTGWYTKDGKTAIDFTKNVENLPGAVAANRTVTVYAGWDKDNIAQVTYDYNYHTNAWPTPAFGKYANKGQAVDFVTAGSKINTPTGVEDYYKTAADRDHGTYTSSSVKGWYSVLDDAPVTVVKASTEVYAQWSSTEAIKLNGNGGFFKNNTNYAYATKADGQSWKDVVETPTRDGYNFIGWTYEGHPVNLAAGKYYFAGHSADLANGFELVAQWVPSSLNKAQALHDRFGLSGWNKDADVKTVVDAGYTEASAKAYVDAWYNLQDEYFAAFKPGDAQGTIDAYNALVPKYEAAEKLLVKSDVTVKPTPAQKIPVYRLYNPGLPQAAQHFYTTSKTEYDNLVAAHGWKGEGVAWYTTDATTGTPVYRLYSRFSSAHFYTTDKAEYEKAIANGWTDEKVAWYVADDADTDVYRLYNEASGEHLYTVNAEEKDNLVANAGWTYEKVEYKVYAK